VARAFLEVQAFRHPEVQAFQLPEDPLDRLEVGPFLDAQDEVDPWASYPVLEASYAVASLAFLAFHIAVANGVALPSTRYAFPCSLWVPLFTLVASLNGLCALRLKLGTIEGFGSRTADERKQYQGLHHQL